LSARSEQTDRTAVLLTVLAWLLFTLVAGFAFFDRELWSDEAITLLLATGHDPALIAPGIVEPAALEALYTTVEAGPVDVWRLAAVADNHPPGYATLLSAITTLSGAGTVEPGWLRAASMALAALFVFAAAPLARRLGASGSRLPLAIVAFSPFAFYLARELRAYGPMLPLVLFAAWLCLRLRDARIRPPVFVAALLAVNLAGCLLHKLFLGVVAAEVVFLAALALADGARRREFAVLAAGIALGTLLLAAPLPNIFSTTPTTGDFETQWLDSSRDLAAAGVSVGRYLAYFVSWWVTPPDDLFATSAGVVFAVAFAPLALFLLALALREAFRLKPEPPALLFIAVPLAFLLAMLAVMGIDLSRSPRFSIVWLPFAAVWLTARLPHGPYPRLFQSWAALAVVVSSTLVLAGFAHTSPDGARRFVALLPDAGPERLVWLDNGTLNAGGLLVALDSELNRADKRPARYEIIRAGDAGSLQAEAAPPPGIVAASRRLTAEIRGTCADGDVIVEGEYAACVSR
jgi:hypothetical protein